MRKSDNLLQIISRGIGIYLPENLDLLFFIVLPFVRTEL